MKHILRYILLLAFALNITSVSAETAKRGDVNGDNTVNLDDVTALADIIKNNGYSDSADLDGDKKVTITDLARLIDILKQLNDDQGLGHETDQGSGAAKQSH